MWRPAAPFARGVIARWYPRTGVPELSRPLTEAARFFSADDSFRPTLEVPSKDLTKILASSRVDGGGEHSGELKRGRGALSKSGAVISTARSLLPAKGENFGSRLTPLQLWYSTIPRFPTEEDEKSRSSGSINDGESTKRCEAQHSYPLIVSRNTPSSIKADPPDLPTTPQAGGDGGGEVPQDGEIGSFDPHGGALTQPPSDESMGFHPAEEGNAPKIDATCPSQEVALSSFSLLMTKSSDG